MPSALKGRKRQEASVVPSRCASKSKNGLLLFEGPFEVCGGLLHKHRKTFCVREHVFINRSSACHRAPHNL